MRLCRQNSQTLNFLFMSGIPKSSPICVTDTVTLNCVYLGSKHLTMSVKVQLQQYSSPHMNEIRMNPT